MSEQRAESSEQEATGDVLLAARCNLLASTEAQWVSEDRYE